MKQKILSTFLLLSILMVGCGSDDVEGVEDEGTVEVVETPEMPGETEQTAPVESISSVEQNVELVEYSYEELYLSVEIPDGWEYEILTAEELAMEDGLVTCSIDFWPAEFPDTVFELGYHTNFGLCLTGVTVEDFVLSNGLSGYRYTELMDDIFWMNITIYNPADNLSGGSYVISAAPELSVWESKKEEFKQILDTVWVGPRTEENVTAETESVESTDLTFADLAKRQFRFSSGAGGWSEEFTIEKDGYFTGNYHDSDMGDTGEGYDAGTMYSSSYSGHFTDLVKINDYTYQMKLADISYKEAADAIEIKDNTRYIYTESYCLGGTDTFTIFLPGTPLDAISEDAYIWLMGMNQDEDELTMIAIVDETNGYGIYSHERFEPLEDAQMTFESYKESYDYYSDKLSVANTTLEMVECAETKYEISDECLNYIWNLIRYNVEEEEFNQILVKQREWISEKEIAAEEARSEYSGGSLASVVYSNTLAELTIERCEELIGYLE